VGLGPERGRKERDQGERNKTKQTTAGGGAGGLACWEPRRSWIPWVAQRRRVGYVGCRRGGLLGALAGGGLWLSGSSLGSPAENLAGGGAPFVAGRRRRGLDFFDLKGNPQRAGRMVRRWAV